MTTEFHRRIVIGVEIEAYSIESGAHKIGRKLSSPRRGVSECDENYTRDASIGSEYNSRPFSTVRESLFLLRSGLRKYLRTLYPGQKELAHRIPLLVGSWTHYTAGTHLHVSVVGRKLSRKRAVSLSTHVHDHLPLLIAVGANSPIWQRQITPHASNRILGGSEAHFTPLQRGCLATGKTAEMCYSKALEEKPPTLEIRILDSNIPQFVVACICLVKAMCLRWLSGKEPANLLEHADYLRARQQAASFGMNAEICWQGEWMPAGNYLDRFLREYRSELDCMDVPDEVVDVLLLARNGFNGSRILHEAAVEAQRRHSRDWEERFARRYVRGLEEVLSGNTLAEFASALRVRLPRVNHPEGSNRWAAGTTFRAREPEPAPAISLRSSSSGGCRVPRVARAGISRRPQGRWS